MKVEKGAERPRCAMAGLALIAGRSGHLKGRKAAAFEFELWQKVLREWRNLKVAATSPQADRWCGG